MAVKYSIRFTLLALLIIALLFIMSIVLDSFSIGPLQPRSFLGRSICHVLRDYSIYPAKMKFCRQSSCPNVIENGVKGHWKIKDHLKQEDVSYRGKMDEEIRLRMDWPASLFRNDSRCGKNFPIPGFRVQGNCDPSSDAPCCNHVSGYCGNTSDHCSCPDCIDHRKFLSAELAEWIPYNTSCELQNFTTEMTCQLLNDHNISLAFIGDSIIRQLSRTMMLLLTGNWNSGSIPFNASQSDRDFCYADHQIAIKRCSMDVAAHSLHQLHQNSICDGKINFHLDLVENYKKYLPDEDVRQITSYLGRRNSFVVMAVGLHYRLDLNAVITTYVDKVIEIVETRGNGWPKIIWMGIHAVPGHLLTEPLFNNKGINEFNKELHEYLSKRNITIIDTFDMSKNLNSYDGLHYGLGLNFQKINILLNYLNELYENG